MSRYNAFTCIQRRFATTMKRVMRAIEFFRERNCPLTGIARGTGTGRHRADTRPVPILSLSSKLNIIVADTFLCSTDLRITEKRAFLELLELRLSQAKSVM